MIDDILAKARQIELLVLDVDGVLTDGGLYYSPDGTVQKKFHVHDGLAIKFASEAGLGTAIITGLDSPAVAARASDVKVKCYFSGCRDKAAAMHELAERMHTPLQKMAFMGDDWVDAPAMRLCALPMAVANARTEIKKMALWTSRLAGGQGAVREAIEMLLSAQGKLDALHKRFGLS